MACILAAKANAQRHREADSGGEGLSLLEENRRRHGTSARLDRGGNTVTQIGQAVKDQLIGRKTEDQAAAYDASKSPRSEEEDKLRAMKGRIGRRSADD
ncbi:hypothetical protein LTR86_001095 [Recurvomyces mirabilis]|nr:hypothetical protein LTR86_001095 [Recurvomyces mirabilis]